MEIKLVELVELSTQAQMGSARAAGY